MSAKSLEVFGKENQGNVKVLNYDDRKIIRLYNTNIAEYHQDGQLLLNTDGWTTRTTQRALNNVLEQYRTGFKIKSIKGTWHLVNAEGFKVEYFDGVDVMALRSPIVINQENLVDYIVKFENGQINLAELLELFSYLVKTGSIKGLQGSYGRTFMQLVDQGFLDEAGNIDNFLE